MGTVTPTAAIRAVGMQGHLTTVIATTTAVTVILLVLSGIGGRMRGIMRAVTLIITGSKRKENVNE